MGQYDILDLLKSSPYKWWTTNQVAYILGLGQTTVSTSFRHLRKRKLIMYQKANMSYVYRWQEI
jgi:predicted transcriptional regulator